MFRLSLTKRYIPAVLLLVLFTVFSHILINKVVNSNQDLAKIINISGKQRMLSQRLIILAREYYETKKKKDIFIKALDDMRLTHKYLLTKILTPKLHEIYYEKHLDKELTIYLSNFTKLLETNDIKYLVKARQESHNILQKLDLVVQEYERYSNKNIQETLSLEFYIMLATLFILFLEVLFIFIPAAKQIEKNTSDLIKNKEYEETVIESNNSAIIAIDYTGTITTYNKKAQEIFGWTKEEMIGTKHLMRIIPDKYKKQHQKASLHYLKTGISSGAIGKILELEGLKKDGTIFPISISFGAKYKKGSVIVVANIVDITKDKEQQSMLVQQSKLASMGEMMQNIAHQWRQPLSAISTAASGIQVEKEYGILNDNKLDERLDTIVDNTQFLSHTIEDFSNFFKKSKDKKQFYVVDVLFQTHNIVKSSFKKYQIELYTNYDKNNKIVCFGFQSELSQVLINIFNNAKDILVEKDISNKILKVDLSKIDDNKNDIVIKIYDNAGGIPKDILPKVFEPYFTTKHKTTGTGIGLHMSSEIIRNHFEGTITASNESFMVDNKEYFGACFTISIPSNVE